MDNRRFKAYIFDLDGVLVDTAVYHYHAWKKLANSLGFDFSESQNEELKGISRIDSLKKILKWGKLNIDNEAEIYRLANVKNDDYVALIEQMTAKEILPGALKFLEKAKQNNIKIALASASKHSSIIHNRTWIVYFYDEHVDGNMLLKSKPNLEVFITAKRLLKNEAQKCVFLEDA